MISLRKKIETAVRMGANCGSLDADTKTVDVAAICRALAHLEQLDGGDMAPALAQIRAAIGEKGG